MSLALIGATSLTSHCIASFDTWRLNSAFLCASVLKSVAISNSAIQSSMRTSGSCPVKTSQRRPLGPVLTRGAVGLPLGAPFGTALRSPFASVPVLSKSRSSICGLRLPVPRVARGTLLDRKLCDMLSMILQTWNSCRCLSLSKMTDEHVVNGRCQ